MLVAECGKSRRDGRKPNAYRQREHLTEDEIMWLMEAARDNRYGARDAAIIFVMFRHGLRCSEACALDWSGIDFEQKELHVRRSKLGKPATHPIRGDELRALRRLHRDAGSPGHGPVFVTERGTAFSRDGLNKLMARAGSAAGFGFRVHPHMLRPGMTRGGSRTILGTSRSAARCATAN